MATSHPTANRLQLLLYHNFVHGLTDTLTLSSTLFVFAISTNSTPQCLTAASNRSVFPCVARSSCTIQIKCTNSAHSGLTLFNANHTAIDVHHCSLSATVILCYIYCQSTELSITKHFLG